MVLLSMWRVVAAVVKAATDVGQTALAILGPAVCVFHGSGKIGSSSIYFCVYALATAKRLIPLQSNIWDLSSGS